MRVALFLALLAALIRMAAAQPPGRSFDDDPEVHIEADEITYDQKDNTVTARGSVQVRRGDTELRAEEVQINRATNEAAARGGVSLADPEGLAFADEIKINLDDETGILQGVSLHSRRLQYSLTGRRIEKLSGQQYSVCNGRFTTCNCESGRQSWSISGDRLDVTREGYGILHGGTFNILDVPVLYLPRAVLPISRERQSGFLMPRVGLSNRRGFQTLLPFYWAISKSQDATLAFDVETAARLGLISEYRYALSRGNRGTLSLSFFNERIRGATGDTPENRWSLLGRQRLDISAGGYAYTDASWVGDDAFFRDMNTYAFEHAASVTRRTSPYTLSKVGLVQGWDHLFVQAEGTYRQNLTGGDAETLHPAPRLDLVGQMPMGPFIADGAAQVVNYERGRGTTGVRADIASRLAYALPLQGWGHGTVEVGGRETAYSLADRELSPNAQTAGSPTTLTRNQTRETGHVGAEVTTSLSRVYTLDQSMLGFDKLKHTVEPVLSYLFVPSVAQDDLPLFDGEDRINHRNLLTYGFVSRFIGRTTTENGDSGINADHTRELARFSAMQSYDLDRVIPAERAKHATDHLSDIDLAARINPSKHFSFRLLGNYDPAYSEFLAARVGFFAESPWEKDASEMSRRLGTHTGIGVSYRFLANNLVHEVDTNLVLRVTDWAGFLYATRYNVADNKFLDNFFGLRLISQCDCWAIDIAVTNRHNPAETEVSAQLTLVGLSSSQHQVRHAVMP